MKTASGAACAKRRFVHLIASESGFARGRFFFLAHAGPHVGVDRLRAGDGFFGRVQNFDFAARFAGYALRFGDDSRIGLVARGCGHANMRTGARADAEQRMADVVAVADVGDFQAAQIAEAFFEREEIGERLAGMVAVGKRVDHRNVGVQRRARRAIPA